MHTIDAGSRGADGVRLGDVDRDGQLDIITGWEEGGAIRICFQPAGNTIRNLWPVAQVGSVKSPEDAVFADINKDSWLDVVTCCEGKEQAIYVHLNPGKSIRHVRDGSLWETSVVSCSRGVTRWMFCQPLKDSFILGSKDPNAQIAELTGAVSTTPTITSLRKSGWIMSLRRFDVDQDGDADIIYSDRKGTKRGIGWLEYRSERIAKQWVDHTIGGQDHEVMFLDVTADAGKPTITCNTRNGHLLELTPSDRVHDSWIADQIPHPANVGDGKGVAIGDLNNDGIMDLACSCEHAESKSGVYWLERCASTSPESPDSWQFHDISGSDAGIKFDRIELLDVDQDGDLDLITCEERDNLGVIWYENPLKRFTDVVF